MGTDLVPCFAPERAAALADREAAIALWPPPGQTSSLPLVPLLLTAGHARPGSGGMSSSIPQAPVEEALPAGLGAARLATERGADQAGRSGAVDGVLWVIFWPGDSAAAAALARPLLSQDGHGALRGREAPDLFDHAARHPDRHRPGRDPVWDHDRYELAAVGAAGAFLLALQARTLNWKRTKEAVFLTAKTTAMVCWLFVGSALFSAVSRCWAVRRCWRAGSCR